MLTEALGDDRVPPEVRRACEENRTGAVVADGSRILASNDYYANLVGYTIEEVDRGELSWLRITAPDYVAADARAIAQLRSTGRADVYDKEFVARDGSRVAVRLTDLLLSEEPLRILAVIASLDDDDAVRVADALDAAR